MRQWLTGCVLGSVLVGASAVWAAEAPTTPASPTPAVSAKSTAARRSKPHFVRRHPRAKGTTTTTMIRKRSR